MKTLITALMATALTASFTASAANTTSNDLKMKISSVDNRTIVTVTDDGKPMKNYPIQVKGLNTTAQKMTSDQGSLTIQNHSNQPQRISFTVQDTQGNKIVKQRFVTRDS